ncbi:MAG: prepilin peptidase [Candidatus Paceibacterota bacterium]|jgi:leader peptidase (prepilin peptidase)/N-methyltransferase
MIEIVLIFIFGLIIGSFLNCVIWRLYKEESFVGGKSYCPHCRHSLCVWDLFPLLSFVFLGGKCRYCKEKISIQYPLVELLTAVLFSGVYLFLGSISVQLIFWLIMMAFFVVIFVFDLKYFIIPDEVSYGAIFLSIAWILYSFFIHTINSHDVFLLFASGLGASLFFFLIWFFSRGMAMGFGDVKLALLIGLLLGFPNTIVGLFLGFLLGAIIGSVMVFFKKRGFASEVPFAPFLITGTIIAFFFGSRLVDWYLSLSFKL